MDAPASLPPVVPGLHRPLAGAHDVLWWDPSALKLEMRHGAGVRREELLADGEATDEGRRAHAAWRARREAVGREAAVPTLASVSARTVGRPPPSPIPVEEVEVDRPRPGGRRFGALVHVALSLVPLDADASVVASVVDSQARLLGAGADERAAAAVAVGRALAHPLLRRAAASADLRRESPVLLRLADGTVAEGTVDLAFREDGRWVVVELKTDAEIAGNLVAYQAQVGIYLAAVSQATGEPAEGVLLLV
jgi:ATP-dependent exoDNAse (exonuclease V) beta subunit